MMVPARGLPQGMPILASHKASALPAAPSEPRASSGAEGFSRLKQSMATSMAVVYLATSLRPGKSTRVFQRSQRQNFASTPDETYETFVEKAKHLVEMSRSHTLYASILGSAFVSVASASALSFSETVGPNLMLDKLVFAVVLPVHLLLCQLCGGQLTTSNLSILCIGVSQGKVRFRDALRNIALVLFGNAIGVLLILAAVRYLQVLDAESLAVAAVMAKSKCGYTFGQTVVKAFICNWVVFIAYWLGVMSGDIRGKMTGIWTAVFMYAAVGFEHIVTNMFLLPAAAMGGTHFTMLQMVWKNLFPVLLGNVAASILVAGGSFGIAFGRLSRRLRTKPSRKPKVPVKFSNEPASLER